jgi:CysZ protein
LLKELVIAIQSYFIAYRLIRKHGSWKWILAPGLIYAILFGLGLYLFYTTSSGFTNYLMETTNIKKWLQSNNSLLSFLFVTTVVMVDLLLLIFYFSLFKYLFLIICSPIFSFLSERTRGLIDGDPASITAGGILKDARRGISVALRNCGWQVIYFLALILLSFIPVIGWIVPLAGLLVECYYYGFSMMDYSCMRNGLNQDEANEFIGRSKGLPIGNGIVFYIMHLVPVIGWIFAPVYAIVAAMVAAGKMKNG